MDPDHQPYPSDVERPFYGLEPPVGVRPLPKCSEALPLGQLLFGVSLVCLLGLLFCLDWQKGRGQHTSRRARMTRAAAIARTAPIRP